MGCGQSKEPARHNHAFEHLSACLIAPDEIRPQATNADVVELARWFHDAMYVPGSTTNERDSANWAAPIATATAETNIECYYLSNPFS
jgi:predicted metal-dependent HD superfamily phosphohydrolase